MRKLAILLLSETMRGSTKGTKYCPVPFAQITTSHSLRALVDSLYYMSNYATKGDVKLHQLVMTTAILKASLEKAAVEEGDLTAEQRRLLEMRPPTMR